MAHKRQGKKRRGAAAAAACIIAAVIMVFGVGVFFNANEIVVSGTSQYYTEEEIIRASGLKTGKSLLFTDTSGAEAKIRDACPYVNTVTVTREFPSKIHIKIRESSVCAAVEFDGELWLIDQNCRVLGKAEETDQCMIVKGLEVVNASVGSTIEIEDDAISKLDYTKIVLTGLCGDEFSRQVTELNMENLGNITLNIGRKYTVILGSGEKLEYKLSRVESVIGQLAGESGSSVIDVSKDGESFVIKKK